MNKIAFFVEGYTELAFLETMIEEIAGAKKVIIESKRISGGTKVKRTIKTIRAAQPVTGQEYYVLIMDCGGDHQVKTRIIEEHLNLTKSGYSKIVGMRDVRPTFSYGDIPRLERELPKYIKTSLIPVEFVLAVMEIEAWFLAETNHYQNIDPSITLHAIKSSLGFDPQNDDMSQRAAPADDLNNCYMLAAKQYQKDNSITIAALDYLNIYTGLVNKFDHVRKLVASIDSFLA